MTVVAEVLVLAFVMFVLVSPKRVFFTVWAIGIMLLLFTRHCPYLVMKVFIFSSLTFQFVASLTV